MTKNASNQWNPPPFKNAIHVLLVGGYAFLLGLHLTPYFTPLHCLAPGGAEGLSLMGKLALFLTAPASQKSALLCCRYNYAMRGFATAQTNANYCSGRVRVAFAGSWSTGKTYLMNALLGKSYSTAQSAPPPTTDKFVCIAAGALWAVL